MIGPWQERVRDEWIDYNGHLSEAYYVLVFGHATDMVLDHIGVGDDDRAASGTSVFTVEAHIRYLDQVEAGALLEVHSSVIGATEKLLWVWHEMRVAGRVRATEEILGVHVDISAGHSTPFPENVAQRIAGQLTPPDEQASGRIRPIR